MPPGGFFSRFGGRIAAAPAPKTAIVPTKTPEEQLKEDQEVVQKAISDAVTAALKNDAFTKSVAVHLATQLQPALKSALDISTVEENLSKRLDEIQTATTSRLSDLSNDLSTYKSKDKTSSLEESVAQINVLLTALGKDVSAVKAQISEQDSTVLSAHTVKLDDIVTGLKTLQEEGPAPVGLAFSNQSTQLNELATELKIIREQIASPDTSLLSSHTTKLDAIAAEVAAINKDSELTASLKTITSELAVLKTEIESGSASSSTGLSAINKQLATIESAIEAHKTTLSDIRSGDSSSEILAGIKTSNDSHASHTASLSAIASQDSSADIADLKAKVDTLSGTVFEIKSADISPEILNAVKSSIESHAAHAGTLAEIKAAINSPSPVAEKVDLSTIESDVKTIITSIESQNGTLSEIKTVISTPIAAGEKTDISGLEADVKTLIANLDSQSTSLSDIKTSSSGPEILAAIGAQDAVLTELKVTKPSPEILAAIEALKTDVTASKADVTETNEQVKIIVTALPKLENDTVLAEIKSTKAAIEGTPRADNTEVISEIKAIHTLVSQTKEAEILTEIKDIKVIVEKNAAVNATVGEEDKAAEVTKSAEIGSNGVETEVKEVEA